MTALLRLVRTEFRRLFSRRAVLVLLAACIVAPVAIAIGVAVDTRPPSQGDLAAAQEQLARDLEDGDYARWTKRCIKNPEENGLPANLSAEELERECREMNEPQLDWYLWTNELDLAGEQEGSAVAVALLLALLMVIMGTTFVGHDFSSGSVSNQVLFEPRRLRVWLAKAIAVTATALVAGLVVMTGYWLALDAVASGRDLPHGGDLLRDCLEMGWRAAGVAALGALTGFALTMLFRSTVATLGIVFGVALVGGMLLAVLGFEASWNPGFNVLAVLDDGFSYDAEVPCTNGGEWCYEQRTVGLGQGLTYVGVVVVGAVAASLASFTRRDVP